MSATVLRNQKGLTLIELVVAMVIMAIAMTGVLLVINYATSHSADPVLRHQALAIAESYMEEICLKGVADPDGVDEGSTRALFDDVYDYHGLSDSGVHDASGNAVSGLSAYSVNVSVTTGSFGPAANQISAAKIVVTVIDPTGADLSLSGYRAAF